MAAKRILVLCAAVVVCCFTIGMLADEAHAQSDSDSAKAIDKDAGPGPTKLQMAVGIGSCVVAFVVMKWL